MSKKLLSIFLTLCMVVTLIPGSARAEETNAPISISREIISFTPMEEPEKTVSTGTVIEDIDLPVSLTATVRTVTGSAIQADTRNAPVWEETIMDIPVTWASDPIYDMETEGVYVFTPVIKGYTVSTELPEMTVTVGESAAMASRMQLLSAPFGGGNLIVNPGGELGTPSDGVIDLSQNSWVGSNRWFAYDGISGITAHSGNYFMSCYNPSFSTGLLTCYQDISIGEGNQGQTVTLTGWMRSSGGNTVSLTLTQLDQYNMEIGTPDEKSSVSSSWVQETITTTILPNTRGLRVTMSGNLIQAGAAALDDLSLTLSSPPAPANIAEIGTTGYATLQDAVNAVTDGQTIKLLDDILLDASIDINLSTIKDFTLDLNGKTVDSGSNIAINHLGSGMLTIKDSAIVGEGKITSANEVTTICIAGGINTDTVMEIIGGTVANTAAAAPGSSAIYVETVGNVIITGGTISANSGYAIYEVFSSNIYIPSGIVTIQGGYMAMNRVPYLSGYTGVQISGDTTSANGDYLVDIPAAALGDMIDEFKFLRFEPGTIVPSITIDDPTVIEGNSGSTMLAFTITLSSMSTSTIMVDYTTANGTATVEEDYTARSGTLTFAPGETSKTVSVTVIGDTTLEADETVLINLTNPANATIADSQGIGTIRDDDSTVPGAPTIGTATAGDTQATVSFSAPTSDGGASITGYTVTSSPEGITANGAGSPIIVNGLTNGMAYTFTVTATNTVGTGPASASSNGVIPKNFQTITFTNPGAQTFGTSPTLTANSDSGLPVTFTSTTPGVCTITTDGKLTFLRAGSATIEAHQSGNDEYLSAPSVARSFTVNAVAPGRPTIGAVTAGNGKATVTFTAPASDGGDAITGYTVTSSPGGFFATGSSSPITVSGLDNGTSYTFTVTATNTAGTGSASAASAAVVPSAPVAQIEGTTYDSLQEAVDAITTDNKTIKLLADITLPNNNSSSITIASEYSFTLDLNGYTLDACNYTAIKHSGTGTLNITDSGTGGKITSTGYSSGTHYPTIVLNGAPGCTMNVSGGTVSVTGNYTHTIYGANNSCTINVSGGTVTAAGSNSNAIFVSGSSNTVNISGGIVSATAEQGIAIYVYSGGCTVNISGGTVSTTASIAIAIYNRDSSTINVSDEAVITNSSIGETYAAIMGSNSGHLNISGGTVSAPNGIAVKHKNTTIQTGTSIIQGGSKAMSEAPTWNGVQGMASTNYDGGSQGPYIPAQIGNYKYLMFEPAAALTGTATISNTSPRIGSVLNGSLTGGNNTGILTYVWKAGGIQVGTEASYTVAIADLGKTITLEISSSVQTDTVTSTPTAAVTKKAAPAALAAPTLSSKTHNSVSLTENADYAFSRDGNTWQTSNVFTGLTANTTYTFYQRVAETADTEESVASASLVVTTDTIPVDSLTGTVTISGIMKYGQTLTATYVPGNSTGTLSYQWKRGATNIGTNSSTYTLVAVDINQTISCEVRSTEQTDFVTSSPTATIVKADGPAVTGVSAVGCTNTGNNEGKLIGVTTAMEYKKSGAATYNSGTGSDITGLTSGTYLVRVKATTTHNAGEDSIITVAAFIPPSNGNDSGNSGNSGPSIPAKTEGKIEKDQKVDENAPTASLNDSSEDLKSKVLSAAEQTQVAAGKDAKVILKIEDISASVSNEDRKKIEEKLAAEQIDLAETALLYIDISLYKKIGDETETRVTETSGKISISIEVPEKMRKTVNGVDRSYRVIRVHNGVAEVLEGTYDPVTHLFTFETDRFSTYALTYQDMRLTPEEIDEGKVNQAVVHQDFYHLHLTAKAAKTSQKLSYARVSDAEGYFIYGAKCGEKMKMLAEVEGTVNEYSVIKLKQATYYKYQVKAYKIIDGEKVIFMTSKVIHSVTEGKTYANPSKVTSDTTSVKLTAGKSKTVTCQVVLPKSKKLKEHTAVIRYETSNKAIATVNSKGRITAKEKGICYVYAYAQNGVYQKIKVVVD